MPSHIALVVDNPAPRPARGSTLRPTLDLVVGGDRATADGRPDTCLGCPGCSGICHALLDAVNVPDTILKPRRLRS